MTTTQFSQPLLHLLTGGLLLLGFSSCKKFLDAKPDQKLAVPASLHDMELMIDNYAMFNAQHPSAGEVGADDYYLTDAVWLSQTTYNRNLYTWQPDVSALTDWSAAYQRIYQANVVLQTLDDLHPDAGEGEKWNQLRGAALFFRAYYYLALAQLYAPPYNEATATRDPGLPLRLDPDFTKRSVRASVEQTYNRIEQDLQEALTLLPKEPLLKSRPSKPAAYAALARMYLSMRRYNKALLYADSCLQLTGTLLTYSAVNAAAPFPFMQFNSEVIFDAGAGTAGPLAQSRWKADTLLYRSYADNDLRKSLFFKRNADGTFAFKGSYLGSPAPFTGFAVDEMLLTRAEGKARAGQTEEAMADLNTLLEKRWRPGTFTALSAPDAGSALRLILSERRKELVFRTLRWIDLRRLSTEPPLAITPVRWVNGQTYELPPGSPRYVLRIPQTVIDFSNMTQNP